MNTRPPILAALLVALPAPALGGPLNPPAGVVTPTAKPLGEVEPRVAVNSTNTPGTATDVFRITQPGTYYLAGNITAPANGSAIRVSASDVTIDLNGFTISGGSTSTFGVYTSDGAARTVVRNGSLRFPGLTAVLLSADSLVENVTVTGASSSTIGILVGERSVVRHGRVQGGAIAVQTGSDCVVEGLSASLVATGVDAGNSTGVVVRDCLISQAAALSGSGVRSGNRLTIARTRLNGFVIGIAAAEQAVVEGASVTNGTIGIILGKNATLRDVEVITMASSGVQVADASTLESVNVRACVDVGITVTADCALTRCHVSGCAANGVVAGNRNAFVDCASSRNTGGAGFVVIDGNSFTNCHADENAGDGFNGRFGNIFRGCGARTNNGDGIEGSSGTFISETRFDGNGNGTTIAANIRITGDAGRIEANTLVGADFGIQTTSGGNLIIRNSSRNSGNSYGGISPGNDVGPIGAAATATSPWANIQY